MTTQTRFELQMTHSDGHGTGTWTFKSREAALAHVQKMEDLGWFKRGPIKEYEHVPLPSNHAALEAFLSDFEVFKAHVADLGQMVDSHCGTDPDAINWGDVGTLREWNSRLAMVTDPHFKRGAFSEPA